MEKKLTKEKYIKFISRLTGHSKSFIEKNMKINDFTKCYTFVAGMTKYETLIKNGRIYTQYYIDYVCEGSFYHDLDSLEYDWIYSEEMKTKERIEMIKEVISNNNE